MDFDKIRAIFARFSRNSVDVATLVDSVTKIDIDSGGTQQAIPDDLKKVLKQAADSWESDDAQISLMLISTGVFTTIIYENVIQATISFPCWIVAAASVALLTQQTSSLYGQQNLEPSKQMPMKEKKAVWALLAGNILALALYFGSLTDVLLRYIATLYLVMFAIVGTQKAIKINSDDLFRELITSIIKPALDRLVYAERLSKELIEHLVDQKDTQKGCALLRLSQQPRAAVVVEDSSQNFIESIKDCKQRSFTVTKPNEFLTNLVCREMVPEQKGYKRKLLHHVIKLAKSPSPIDTLSCMMKVSRSYTGRLNAPARITMEIKKMALPGGFFLLRTSKGTLQARMVNPLKVQPIRSNTASFKNRKPEFTVAKVVQNTFTLSSFRALSSQTPSLSNHTAELLSLSNVTNVVENGNTTIEICQSQPPSVLELEEARAVVIRSESHKATKKKLLNEKQHEPSSGIEELVQSSNDAKRSKISDIVMINTGGPLEIQSLPLKSHDNTKTRSNSLEKVLTANFKSLQSDPCRIASSNRNQLLSRSSSSKSAPRTQEQVFVYQIIHDLRHPLDSQKAKIEEIRKDIHKKYKQLKNLYGTERKNLMENAGVKSQLARFDQVLKRYAESRKISELNTKYQFISLQKLLLNNHTLYQAKQFANCREMTEPIAHFARQPNMNELSYKVSSGDCKSENKRALSGILEENEDEGSFFNGQRPPALIFPRPNIQGLLQPNSQQDFTFGEKMKLQSVSSIKNKLSSGLLSKGGDLPRNLLSSKSIPDKEILEIPEQPKSPHEESPARPRKPVELPIIEIDEQIEEEEKSVSGDSSSLSELSVGSDGGERGIQKFNESLQPREYSEDFKRGFGNEKDLEQFCKERDIDLPEKPYIKTHSHFGSSLANERLFIESQTTKKAKFDIFAKNNRSDKLEGHSGIQEEESPLNKMSQHSSESRKLFHENISSAKNALLNVINSHQQKADQDEEKPKLSRSIAIQAQQSSSIEDSKKDHTGVLHIGVNAELQSLFSHPQSFELLMLMLTERRLQFDTIEQTLRFMKHVKEEFTKLEAQLNMSKFLMQDLLDHALLKAGSFSIVTEFFNLENVIKMAYQTTQRLAADKKVTLIGPTYSNREHQMFFKCIHGDPRRYLQVLVNFVNNAIKFTMSGGTVTILLEVVNADEKKPQEVLLGNIQEQCQEESIGSAPDKELIDPDSPPDKEENPDTSGQENEENEFDSTDKFTVDFSFKIIVRDTGVGISEANRERLFQNFSRLEETSSKNPSGVGLGLTIARDLIQAFGGTIEIQNPNQIGTDFVINLRAKARITELEYSNYFHSHVNFSSRVKEEVDSPSLQQSPDHQVNDTSSSSICMSQVDQSSIAEHMPPNSNSMESQKQKRQSRAKIFTFRRCLVANDQTFLLDMLEKLLLKEFDQVVAVTDGQQAIDKVLRKPPNYFSMIILDINMPQKDGIAACIEITDYFIDHNTKKKGIDQMQNLPKCASFVEPYPNNRKGSKQDLSLNNNFFKDQMHPLIRVNTVVIEKQPLIFALTSDIDSERVNYFLQKGFHSVHKEITAEVMAQMLVASDLPIRTSNTSSIGDNSSIVFED